MHEISPFELENHKIFWGFPDPFSWGGGHPLPKPHPLGAFSASIFAFRPIRFRTLR